MSIDTKNIRYTPSQLVVINLECDFTSVIEGGPGTGKTLLALNRAEKIMNVATDSMGQNPKLMLIVHNKLLQKYLEKKIKEIGLTGEYAFTASSWLFRTYIKFQDLRHPPLRPPRYEDYDYNWEEIKKDILDWHKQGKIAFDHIIIDEAQDLPIEFIEILDMISKHMTVFIDEEQSIQQNTKTTATAVTNILNVGRGHKFVLTENHRNYQEIIDLSLIFSRSDLLPDRSIKKSGGRRPMLRIEKEDEFKEYIKNYAAENTDQTIAILVVSRSDRESYYNDLKNTGVNIQQHISSSDRKKGERDLDPVSKGMKLLTVHATKGLEFDTVFIPKVDDEYWSGDECKMNQAMVSITRANERLIMHADSKISDSHFTKKLLSEDHSHLIDIVEQDNHTESELDTIPF